MSFARLLILAAAALSVSGCLQTDYGSLYPLPLNYRRGVPERNFGGGPLPTPGPSTFPKRSPARLPTPQAR